MDICDDQPIFGENIFSLYYRKINTRDFFSSLEESQLGIKNSKNYIPIYETYFNMNETNFNSINLNQRFYVSALSGVIDKNNIQAAVVDAFKSTKESLTIVHKPIFIKFSPLIDPVKYMSGKYENINTKDNGSDGILNIPTLSKLEKNGHSKANDKNNAAYVDGFFSYLSSQVLNCHDFIHGLNFYGSFNAIKEDFYYNAIDDIEYLDKNPFFNKNKDNLFSIEDKEYSDDEESINSGEYIRRSKHNYSQQKNTRNKKDKITIIAKNEDNLVNDTILVHDDFDKVNSDLNSIFNLSSELVSPIDCNSITNNDNLISLSTPLHDIIADGVVESSDSIVLKKDSNINYDSDTDDSCTSRSCSSRSSYTHDSQTDNESVGLGSGCDIHDIISLDNSETVEGGEVSHNKSKGEKNNKNNKNNKNTSKTVSEDSYTEDENSNSENYCSNKDKKNGNGSGNGSGNDGGRGNSKDDDDSCDYEDDDDDDDDGYDDDETLWATIKNFPVSAIMLEKCDNTLDYLMMQEKEMTENEWRSALMQIIMTLITYQKLFGFTHNDLHTNNVMFIYTEKEYIYYHYNKKYYRVPTYNRAFKIIDFGRAIYKYKSKVICSDSFSMTGDAATQYNCEPYFNDKKPRLEPNFSFDLCRLGCSIFDYFIDDINNVASICKKDPLARLIVEWVTDDQNRNILYKANGEERYPDFKLYKMIARNVHNHMPHMQLSKPIFAEYEFPKKKVKSSHRILNIDKMPCYME
jgi:hypothetical protein